MSSRVSAGFRLLLRVSITWAVGASATAVDAHPWPRERDWKAMSCGLAPAFDPRADMPGADGPLDVVGTADAPALYTYADGEHLYVRMRVDGEPVYRHALQPFGWAVQVDTDLERDSYELMTMVDGIRELHEVRLSRNLQHTQVDAPADQPERVLDRSPIVTHARVEVATGTLASRFGDDPDYFVDMALPIRVLTSDGLSPASVVRLLMGTSANGESIDADVACHDATSGGARWSQVATDAVRLDGERAQDEDEDGLTDAEEARLGTAPDRRDSDGDGSHDGEETRAGTDPHDAANRADLPTVDDLGLRAGASGCSLAAHRIGSGAPWCAAMALLIVLRRPRGRCRSYIARDVR